jgi:hypothetical protein
MEVLDRSPIIHIHSPKEKYETECKFVEWILDLDQREEDFCKKNPEKKEEEIVLASDAMLKALPAPKVLFRNRCVELKELYLGSWVVCVDGVNDSYFYGENAHTRATARLNQLLNIQL